MAEIEDIQQAIGCLSTVYPQFVAKELALLTDSIATAIQGFTDPFAAAADASVESILDGVSELSEGDVFDNLSDAAVGLSFQFAKREAEEMLADMANDTASPSKRSQVFQNLASNVVTTVHSALAIYPDMPYVAAQKICETIVELTDLKARNITCLRKHMVQLTNCVFLAIENEDYKDNTMSNVQAAKDQLKVADDEMAKSLVQKGEELVFDQNAFTRAREAVLAASRILAPDKDGISILDVAFILTEGTVEAGHKTNENAALIQIVIPSLINLVQLEIAAIVSQVEVINFYILRLAEVIDSFRKAGNSSLIQQERFRAIRSIQAKIVDLCDRMQLALDRNSSSEASREALLWISRLKAILATMDHVNVLTLEEGSIEGPDKAFELEQAYLKLTTDLSGIETSLTEEGIEDPLPMRDKILALTAFAGRVIEEIDEGKVSSSKLATFHKLAQQTAEDQLGFLDESLSVALRQKAICQEYANINLGVREPFDDLVGSLQQLGQDRGVDLMNLGQFAEFLDSGFDKLSYLGAAVNCLTDALQGIDDDQTRKQITDIRDEMVARKSNHDLAAVDAADQGRSRFITKLKTEISNIQRNAKVVESIVDSLTEILNQAGEAVGESFGVLEAFLGNLDQLAVGAGGRLSAGLEEFSEHPNAGVPLCEAL